MSLPQRHVRPRLNLTRLAVILAAVGAVVALGVVLPPGDTAQARPPSDYTESAWRSGVTPAPARRARQATPVEPLADPSPLDQGWALPYPDEPGSIERNGVLAVINKQNPVVPRDFRPAGLVRVDEHYVAEVVAEPLAELLAAARVDGLRMRTRSGFRSYQAQAQANAAVISMLGAERADQQSARAGHSEHQSGLAVDLLPFYGHECADFSCFASTPHADWLADNAYRFGFVVRYEEGQEGVTGFTAEPWHVRYIGREAAAVYRAGGFRTLEEFLSLPPAPHY